YLRWFTEFGRGEIESLEASVEARPEARDAQRALAGDITKRTHGAEAAAAAIRDSEAMFSAAPITDPEVLASLHASTNGFTFPARTVASGSNALLTEAGVFASKSEGRRLISGGGVTINGVRLTDPDHVPEPIAGEWLEVRIGKRRREIGRQVG
ncbi:MAG TPA: S4 domain-containing protein, partial [Candidatus Bathyarchaeia archaeon]|nr:S4 domain-containing protein [Candidatus Bathyarchaeia archaeon]